MQQETKSYVSDIIGITEVAPKAALQITCFSHVIVNDRSVIVTTFPHGKDMRVVPLFTSAHGAEIVTFKIHTLLSFCLMKHRRKESDQK